MDDMPTWVLVLQCCAMGWKASSTLKLTALDVIEKSLSQVGCLQCRV